MVLFGGVTGQNDTLQPLGDAYSYDPKLNTWQNATPSKAPAPRYGASMAFYTGNALLFGGNLDPSTTDREHWSWDSFNWTLLEATDDTHPESTLAPRGRPGPDGKLLLYGGCKDGSLCVLNRRHSRTTHLVVGRRAVESSLRNRRGRPARRHGPP